MRSGKPAPARDLRVGDPALAPAVTDRTVRRAITAVLDGEGVGAASISVTFVSAAAMRRLNHDTFGHDRATDVIAFPLAHPGCVVGDIYVCPDVARAAVGAGAASEGEELVRLVVHGTLHVLGHEHPDGDDRVKSPMWQRQESYVQALQGDEA